MLPSPKLALVAEDNAALRRVIAFTLRNAGFEVTAACDGQVAWESAEHEAFDLVVTDQQMPNLNGLELVERLRASEHNSATPVVLLTAKGLELDLDRVREQYGVAEMLTKPFSPTQLSSVAEQLASQPA
ncbi:Alkaline phosphatase synthesis transcriptional regulatory protein PhoP [Planctomycetes bacterium MalM25]|nr:Alkaline phosphatase synthesis transcriptional regulatory protein PhoP [Planctomycetes bacterium MalM25]